MTTMTLWHLDMMGSVQGEAPEGMFLRHYIHGVVFVLMVIVGFT